MNHACLQTRGVLRITGPDKTDFLQNLLSNDVTLVSPGHSIYACLLTPQGKFLHDLFVLFESEDSVLIDCEKERRQDLITRLNRFKLRSQITIMDVSDCFDVYAFWGDVPVLANAVLSIDPRSPEAGMRGVFPKDHVIDHGEEASYEPHRLKLGLPDGSRDMIVEKSTLLEGNMDRLNGISWDKGCFVGQEVTVRMKHRNLVKKRLFPVRAAPGHLLQPGTKITNSDQKDVGVLRSCDQNLALACLSIRETGTGLKAGDIELTL